MKQLKKIGKNLDKADQKKILGGTWPECRVIGESCSLVRTPSGCCEGLICVGSGHTGLCDTF